MSTDAELHQLVEQQRQELERQRKLIKEQKSDIAKLTARNEDQQHTISQQAAQIEVQADELRSVRRFCLSPPGLPRPSPKDRSKSPACFVRPTSQNSPATNASLILQLEQTRADKAVLVRQLQLLVKMVAHARSEADRHEDVAQRTLEAAWRLGQLGQAGIALAVQEMTDQSSSSHAQVHQ